MHTTKALAILAFTTAMATASPVGLVDAGKEHVDVPNYSNSCLDKREEAKVHVPNYSNSYLDKKGEAKVDVPNYSNSYLD